MDKIIGLCLALPM